MKKNSSRQIPVICILFVAVLSTAPRLFAATVNLTVNGATKQGTVPHFWSECVGTGTMVYCLKPEWQVAAKIGAEEAGFKRVRGHGILIGWNGNDEIGFFHWNGTGTPTYTWDKFDAIYDFIVKTCKMQPIVELSFMPKDLQSNTVISKPKNWDIWRDLVHELVSHCIERYGLEEVRSWYWEVWNEYDYTGFWNGSQTDYYMLYQKAVEGAKSADSLIMVGGPSTTQSGSGRLTEFLDYCKTNNVKVDFLSNHCYGGGASGPNADPATIRNDNRTRADIIKQSGKKLFSLNTEYSSSYSGQGGNTGANCISMDSHGNAPFVVKCIKLILDDHTAGTYAAPEVLSYWAISDVFDEAGNNKGSYIEQNNKIPFGEVFGLITYQGIRKATFNAFKMLHMTGTTRLSLTGGSTVADGVDGFATVNADSTEVAVIIYNFYQALSGTGNENTVNLTVNALPLPSGEVKVHHYRVDETHSNAYDVWVKQGKPKSPSTAQWDAMREASNLAEIRPAADFSNSGNAYTETVTLPRQSVSLLLFKSSSTTTVGSDTEKYLVPALAFSGTTVKASGRNTAGGLTVAIFSLDGKLVNIHRTMYRTIDVSEIIMNPGIYLVKAQAGDGRVLSRFIKF